MHKWNSVAMAAADETSAATPEPSTKAPKHLEQKFCSEWLHQSEFQRLGG